MKIQILAILLIILSINSVSAQATDFYISPGIQVAYSFGSGLTWGAEVSVGGASTFNNPPWFGHLSFSLGVQKIPGVPNPLSYVNLNAGVLAFGLSIGQTFYDNNGINIRSSRYGYYAGLFIGFLQYERMIHPLDNQPLQSIGLWGKIPYKIPTKKGETWQGVYIPT